MAVTDLCERCAGELHGLDETEHCAVCGAALCAPCWDATGVCAAPACVAWQDRMRAAKTPAERDALFAELGPMDDPKIKRRPH